MNPLQQERKLLQSLPIILIGMPGSGKSTTGQLLAQLIWVKQYDVDDILEQKVTTATDVKTTIKVSELLWFLGDDMFLKYEAYIVRNTFKERIRGIISLSGSVPLVDATMKHLSGLGTFVYLDTPFAEIEKRKGSMLTDRIVGRYDENGRERTFEEIYHIRHAQYEKWAARGITIKTDGKGKEEILEELLGKVSSFVP